MSIVTTLKQDRLIPMHNEIELTFYSTFLSGLTTIGSIQLSGSEYILKYSPNNDLKFNSNIKGSVKSVANKNNLSDTNDYCYYPTSSIVCFSDFVKKVTLTYKVYVPGGSYDAVDFDYFFINGVYQPDSTHSNDLYLNSSFIASSEQKEGKNFVYKAGFPFDIPVYSSASSFHIVNRTNGFISKRFSIGNRAFRVVICDGETDSTINGSLPLSYGVNSILFIFKNSDNSEYICPLNIIKQKGGSGPYLKWMNEYGSWNFWQFDDKKSVEIVTKVVDSLETKKSASLGVYSPSVNFGVEYSSSLFVNSGDIPNCCEGYFRSIFSSPKIYLYNGKHSVAIWTEIFLETKSIITSRGLDKLIYKLEFKQPNKVTQAL